MIGTGVLPTWRMLAAAATAELGDRLEAWRIVCHAGGIPFDDLLRHGDDVVPAEVAETARRLLARRRAGEPLQRVLGTWGFRSLDVVVDGRALVPRPETEIVVEHALAELRAVGEPYEVVELGTGSGVIALSIATEEPKACVLATDRSPEALALARENLARQSAGVRSRVRFAEGDWFRPVPHELVGGIALIVSNPPYLAAEEWPGLEGVVRDYDPYDALVAGVTGLEAVGTLVESSPGFLRPAGALVVEIAPSQAGVVLALAEATHAYGSAEVGDDLAGRPPRLRGTGTVVIVGEEEAAEALASGDVVAIPTDTVYGLAVDPGRRTATERLFVLKGRPDAVALPVLVADGETADRIGVLEGCARRLADRFWPGALTLVVERAPEAAGYELGGDARSIGLRCPAHAAARALLRRTGPLAVSSANRHGEAPCHSVEDVTATFGSSLPTLDGGACDGLPSTVVRFGPRGLQCLREGAIAIAELERLLADSS